LVTRWKVDGATLRIETGLLRRDSRQLPIARIQAVDLVRPFLARMLGLAELRVRLAGAGDADARLAYLTEPGAEALRARLLAAHPRLDPATPEPAGSVGTSVPTRRLARSAPPPAALPAGGGRGGRGARGPGGGLGAGAGRAAGGRGGRRGRGDRQPRAGRPARDRRPAGVVADHLRHACLAAGLHPVRVHRGRLTRWRPDPARIARHGGRDHPGAADPGSTDDRTAVVAAAALVPPRGRRGGAPPPATTPGARGARP